MGVCAGPWRRRGERIYFTLAIKQRIVLGTMSIRGGSEERARARAHERERDFAGGGAGGKFGICRLHKTKKHHIDAWV